MPAAMRRPGERKVGSRIRVCADKAEAAARCFDEAGFEPIYIEERSDGTVSFWFGHLPGEAQWALITCIPRDFYALRAVVGSFSAGPQ